MGLSEEEYNRLSQIAPTIAPPANTPDGGISWQDLTTTVGKALDQEERAKQLVADVEAAFTKAKTDHPEFVGASGLNAYPAGDGTFQAYPPPDPGGQLLVSLGFEVPQAIIDLAAGQAWVTISAEQARLFDIDVVVWLVEDYSVRDRLLADPVYSQLNVAKQGRHVFLAYKEDAELAAATSMQTVLSLPFLIDGLSPKLAAALDGDPATV
jgi:iron complex transport system substrate-binding protein